LAFVCHTARILQGKTIFSPSFQYGSAAAFINFLANTNREYSDAYSQG